MLESFRNTAASDPNMFRGAFRLIRLAFAALTILPVGGREAEASSEEIAASRIAFPVVGLILGLIYQYVYLLSFRFAHSSFTAACFTVLAGVIATGGLHLDGAADSADGLFLAGDRDRRLAAMRDPHIGSYGVIALIMILLIKTALLAAIRSTDVARALILGGLISRTLIVFAAGFGRYARRDGTGKLLIDASNDRDAGFAVTLVLIAASLIGRGEGLIAAVSALAIAYGIVRFARKKIGGITGDILGAVVELTETAVYAAYAFQSPQGDSW